jgi:hypothetical protein
VIRDDERRRADRVGSGRALRHDRRTADDSGRRGLATPRRPRLPRHRTRPARGGATPHGRSNAHHRSSSRASRVSSWLATSATARSKRVASAVGEGAVAVALIHQPLVARERPSN